MPIIYRLKVPRPKADNAVPVVQAAATVPVQPPKKPRGRPSRKSL